ncbi:related to Ino eighty subunit 5 [Zygosaccharomyces bailii ISA1307]|nr:related to Ino eighty subunit 5 [Zygosaccharomyces bailii ISA1307]
MGKASGSTEADYRKLLSRNDELTKQEATLKKEYTTLLRKISSLCSVLDHLESDIPDEPGTLSEKALKRVPGLQWHNDQVNLLQAVAQQKAEITMPVELIDSYKLYKGTPLLHRDIQ